MPIGRWSRQYRFLRPSNTGLALKKIFCWYAFTMVSMISLKVNSQGSERAHFLILLAASLLGFLNLMSCSTSHPVLPTPKYFCQYSKQPESVCSFFFFFFFSFFCGCTINQSKQRKCQRMNFLSFVLQEQCKNSHFQLYRRTTKPAHYDRRFISFTSA